MLNWNATRDEMDLIVKIMDRVQEAGSTIDRREVSMDLEAVHCNGCPLELDRMASGHIGDVLHDVHGISKNIDRKTGKLKRGFQPRFAA